MNERKGFSIAGIPFVGLCVPVAIVGLVLLLLGQVGRPFAGRKVWF